MNKFKLSVLSAFTFCTLAAIANNPQTEVSVYFKLSDTEQFIATQAVVDPDALYFIGDVLKEYDVAYDKEWIAKCVDQEKRFDLAEWDDDGNLIT